MIFVHVLSHTLRVFTRCFATVHNIFSHILLDSFTALTCFLRCTEYDCRLKAYYASDDGAKNSIEYDSSIVYNQIGHVDRTYFLDILSVQFMV